MEYLYMLYSVDAYGCWGKKLDIKYKTDRLLHPEHKGWTMEEFIAYEQSCGRDPEVTVEFWDSPVAYFLTEKEALHAAEADFWGYSDDGCYPYGVVKKVPLNRCDTTVEKAWLFRHSLELERFREIPFDTNRVTVEIARRYGVPGYEGVFI